MEGLPTCIHTMVILRLFNTLSMSSPQILQLVQSAAAHLLSGARGRSMHIIPILQPLHQLPDSVQGVGNHIQSSSWP